jgi:starch-binding outer membrane protein, SusD/RagB family
MKMKLLKLIIACLVLTSVMLSSCDDFPYLEPSPGNQRTEKEILSRARYAEGILLNAYNALPNLYTFEESASDDAVTNLVGRDFKRMNTGEWSSQFTPVSVWNANYTQIFYLNYFLHFVNDVEWSWDSPIRNELFRQRFTGEALAFRAWYYTNLLIRHGGLGSDNNMLGFIIMDKYTEPVLMNPHIPRNSFEDCVNFILADCDSAIKLLPLDYAVHEDYNYNLVFGAVNKNRISGRHAMAIKSRMLLHAASPSFNPGNDQGKWAAAANASGELLRKINGLSGFSGTGLRWYLNENDPDIIWRRDRASILSWEQQNFPPSVFGNGRDNPTQNLVDAFPMKDGYPIAEAGSGYNEASPYTNRDPRLQTYILYNGNRLGTLPVVNTSADSPTSDGINKTPLSTVTGYYVKKLMNESVRLTPNATNPTIHFYTLFRYTEIFLNYAEAANEAWGPDSDPEGYGMTARDVIRAIRNRAGITQPDDYLSNISGKDAMRTLIHNERRIELCFEGFRFWDIRRWNLNLSEPARGMRIEGGVHTVIQVEDRLYQPHMKYGPIPYRELLNNKNLLQNKDWN